MNQAELRRSIKEKLRQIEELQNQVFKEQQEYLKHKLPHVNRAVEWISNQTDISKAYLINDHGAPWFEWLSNRQIAFKVQLGFTLPQMHGVSTTARKITLVDELRFTIGAEFSHFSIQHTRKPDVILLIYKRSHR